MATTEKAAKQVVVGEVMLKDVRLSFAHLFRPKPFGGKAGDKTTAEGEGSGPRFQSSFLMDKTTESGKKNIANVKAAINAVVKAKWNGEMPKKITRKEICLGDGDLEDYEGYAGHYVVRSARPGNGPRPKVVGKNPRQVLTEADGVVYSGCYVNALIRVYAQDNKFGKRINASLEAVQFVRDGDAFGAPAVDPEDVFSDIDDGEGFFGEEPPPAGGEIEDLLG